MNNFLAKIPLWLPHDKCMHFIGGLILFMLCIPFVHPWHALIIVTVIGVAKEGYDSRHNDIHTPDSLDAVATAMGGCSGWAVILLNSVR